MTARAPTFREALGAWTRVALSSFGGPAGQIAVIHRVIVEEKGWVEESRFLHALGYCMLLPGPEAQQLATYLGWWLHGLRGALTAGLLFVLPGFVTILALSIVYVRYGDTTLLAGAFYGIKPAVLAIVLLALGRFRRRALERRGGAIIAGAAFLAMFFLRAPYPLVIGSAIVLGLVLYGRAPVEHRSGGDAGASAARPSTGRTVLTALAWLAIWWLPVLVLVSLFGSEHVLVREALFFSKVGVITFGGAYAVLAYVAQQAVDVHRWVTPAQMLDGLGLAESTPGPLIMVVQFVAFLGAVGASSGMEPRTAGVAASVVATWVTFAPSFLFILVGAPYVEFLRGNRWINGALAGVTCAVAGVVLNLAVWFGVHALFARVDTSSYGALTMVRPALGSLRVDALVIALGATLALWRGRVGLLLVLLLAAIAGIAARSV